MHRFNLTGLLGLLAAGALAVAGCGSSDSDKTDTGGDGGATAGKKGGKLTVLSLSDVQSLDPGAQYYQYDYMAIAHTTQRGLYGWEPDKTEPSPDLAAGMPETSADGKTITIKIKPNIKYSAPLADRTVTSADFKYALERSFKPQVANGYVSVYLNTLSGLKAYTDGKAKEISGIQTPDDTTLVLKLDSPSGVVSNGQVLALPASVPVPQDYAAKYDKGKASTYGLHQVFTGPYMIANDGKGELTGYVAGKKITLVRNPSWDASTDYRPAYADTIEMLGGNDISVASRRILSGSGYLSGDFAAPPTDILKSALANNKDQLSIEPSQGLRYISLNTKVKPFDNINVRRAVSAAIDRDTLRLTRGGTTLGPVATHFLPPDIPGFEEAGGLEGPGFDFASNPKADLDLAMEYMKKAGYSTRQVHRQEDPHGRRQPAAGLEDRRGDPEPAQGARLQAQLPPGLAPDDVREVLPGAQGRRRDLSEPRLGQGLLRRAVDPRPDRQRAQHRADEQRQHGAGQRSEDQRGARQGRRRGRSRRARQALRRGRQDGHGGRVLHRLAVGQPDRPALEERQRRAQQVQLVLGSVVQLVEVSGDA